MALRAERPRAQACGAPPEGTALADIVGDLVATQERLVVAIRRKSNVGFARHLYTQERWPPRVSGAVGSSQLGRAMDRR